jgi:hypothetical protein
VPNGNGKTFNPTITLGNVLILVSIVATVLVAWGQFKEARSQDGYRLMRIEGKLDDVAAQQDQQGTDIEVIKEKLKHARTN